MVRVGTQVRQLVQHPANLLDEQDGREASENRREAQPSTRRQPTDSTHRWHEDTHDRRSLANLETKTTVWRRRRTRKAARTAA
jgi:hypothetical protein